MLLVKGVRKILDEIAAEVGIQEINEKNYGNFEIHNVFYLMSGSESYFMNFTWYDSGSWRVEVADKIMVKTAIFTTGNMTIYPRGFDNFAFELIKKRLEELITDYNKVRKEIKLKEILNARGKYGV